MATRLDHDLMELALCEAMRSLKKDQLPVGAVIADRAGTVLGKGHKSPRMHWRLDHAELAALRVAIPSLPTGDRKVQDRVLADLTLYTTLEPCVMCIGAIMNCRISRVVYALEDPYGGGSGLVRTGRPPRHEHEYPDIVGGVLRNSSRTLFRDFFVRTGNTFWQNPDNPLVSICMGP